MIIYYGFSDSEFLSLSYNSTSTEVINGTAIPQLLRIYLEGINNGWKNDSYVIIRSEFGTTERISLNGKLSTNLFIHFSYGLIPETLVTSCDEYSNVDSSTKILHIASNACNDDKLTTFTTERLRELIYLEIDSWNFKTVNTFNIDNNHKLENVNIRSNSFVERKTQYDTEFDNDGSASFRIANCDSLKSIEIGDFCFASYGGVFELKNLPLLESIAIGSNVEYSQNFYWSSFDIRGNSLLLYTYNDRSSKSQVH